MSETLELYYSRACPYCHMVMQVIDELGVRDKIEFKNIYADETARQTLISVGGKQQVPCLFIDGNPLYESSDIAKWLRARYQA